ncbi:MAG: aldo/keto reductase [Methylobacterium sp.]|nr:aldo/keto reductase [Methylobacterium sp.]MCA3614435.1 aldo/keto reductase [Methylobacterium sp.]MCA3627690.1 aldo/keto reductase [Methylobacterium sp.]MCA4910342.1 aldo/keto reductase [Methylobacterium sp.]
MEHRPLGRTGLKVPVICLGTMTWGQQNTEAEGHEQMDYALDQGVNFFDTAELYSIPPKPETQGSTEKIIGTWFRARKNRDKVILATKVVGRSDMDWFREDGSKSRLTPAQMRFALERSLRNLKTDYVDLYQLHFPERPIAWGSNPTRFDAEAFRPAADETPIAMQLETLQTFVREGKVRHIGLSNESPWGTMRFLAESEAKGLPRVASIQNAYNLLNRTYETGLAEIGLREDVGLLCYSALGQGYLTGKYLDGARPAGARTTLFNRGQRYEKPGTDDAVRDYLAIASEAGLDPATFAIAFTLDKPFLTSTIIGATTMAQLKIAIAAGHVRLPKEIQEKIDAVHQRRGNTAP